MALRKPCYLATSSLLLLVGLGAAEANRCAVRSKGVLNAGRSAGQQLKDVDNLLMVSSSSRGRRRPFLLVETLPRGGSSSYDNYSDDDDEDEEEDLERRQQQRRRPSPSQEGARRRRYQQNRRPPPPPPPSSTNRGKRNKSSSNVLKAVAKKSVQLGTGLVAGTAQQTGRAAYYLVQPKRVDRRELLGLWRIDQQWNGRLAAAAEHVTIELTADGNVIVSSSPSSWDTAAPAAAAAPPQQSGGRQGAPPRRRGAPAWKFTPAQWPKRAAVEFRLGPDLLYRGRVHRKLAAPNVLKLRGQIYRLEPAGWRGRSTTQVLAGTFVARRRLLRLDDEDKQDDDDEQWEEEADEEEEYDDGVDDDEYEDKHQPRDLNPVPDDDDDVDRDPDGWVEEEDDAQYDRY